MLGQVLVCHTTCGAVKKHERVKQEWEGESDNVNFSAIGLQVVKQAGRISGVIGRRALDARAAVCGEARRWSRLWPTLRDRDIPAGAECSSMVGGRRMLELPGAETERRRSSVSLIYWATILAACSIGETCADLVSHELGFGYVRASAMFIAAFLVLAAVERWIRIPDAARYWVAIALMSTTGTALADLFTRTLSLGYTGTSLFLGVLFCGALVGWDRLRNAPGVHRVDAEERLQVPVLLEHTELPDTDAGYWAAIMIASTLGTSLGDFVSNVLDVGFGVGTLLLGAVLAVLLLAEHVASSSSVARYWAALVTTSTIGATSGDYLTKEDGLGFPFSWVIAGQIAVFVVLILLGRRRQSGK